MHRLLSLFRWTAWPLAAALILAATLQGAVHSAAPGSPLAEICTASGPVSLALPGEEDDGMGQGPMCQL